MKIPGLGNCEKDDDDDICYSNVKTIKALDFECEFIVEGYCKDENKEGFHQAIKNFIGIEKSEMKQAEPYVFEYYKHASSLLPESDGMPVIKNSSDVWSHVSFGFEATVSRRDSGDKAVYVSIECNCEWEPEHGLQLVFRNGNVIAKVGPFDGHLSNADAFGNPRLENIIYYHA